MNRLKFNNLTIYYQNCRGLRTKTNTFYSNLCCTNYDVLVLTETWLNSSVLSSELFDDRYVVYRRDRETTGFHPNKDGGGVLIAVSTKISSKCIDKWYSKCEDLWVTIDISTAHKPLQLALCAVYLPPPVSLSTIEHFIEQCNGVSESANMPICIIGDFNLAKIDWAAGAANSFLPNTCLRLLEFMNVSRLSQYNLVKNCSARILDLVLSTVSSCTVSESSCSLTTVDKLHPPLDIDISFLKEPSLPYNVLNKRKNFYKANYEQIITYINEHDWLQQFANSNDPDSMLKVFYEVLNNAINEFVPNCKSMTCRYPPWFNKEIIRTLKEKNKIRLRFKKYKNPLDEVELKLISKRCQNLVKTLYNDYMEKLESEIKENPKLFWTHVKAKRGGSSVYPLSMTDGQTTTSNGSDICGLFGKYFASVYTSENSTGPKTDSSLLDTIATNSQCLITPELDSDILLKKLQCVNIRKGAGPDGIPPLFISACASALATPLLKIYKVSLATGIFPSEWKKAKVVPVYKSDKKDTISNYRPIAILSTFAKIFESMICPYIQRHFRLYLSDHQHGFVASRSTATNLLSFSEALIESIDSNKQFDVLYTDFSKAFDKIPHSILIEKLAKYGISGPLLKWLESYLTKREFYVVVNGFRSTSNYGMTSGAPQGSHLAPILFILFINDIVYCFYFSECFLYADDLKFGRRIESSNDIALLQDDLNRVVSWCRANKMELNFNKCYHVSFSRKLHPLHSEYFISNDKILEVDEIKDLGVLFDKKITFVPHVENIVKKASKMLGFVLRNSKGFKHVTTKIMLYNSLVRSVLEYCSVVWRPHYATHKLLLERVQKRFLWHLAFSRGKSKQLLSYNTRLKYFKMQSLTTRREVIDALFLYKLLRNKIDCPNLLSLIKFRAPARYPRYPITPLCPPLRKTVLGTNSPISRLCKTLNSCSDLTDIHHDSIGKFCKMIVEHSSSSHNL